MSASWYTALLRHIGTEINNPDTSEFHQQLICLQTVAWKLTNSDWKHIAEQNVQTCSCMLMWNSEEPTFRQQFSARQWISLRHPIHQRRAHWPRQVDASPLASTECGTSVPDQGQVSIGQQLQVLRSRTKEFYKSVCKLRALWLSITWTLSPWITVKLFKRYEKCSWQWLWTLSRVFSLQARCKVQLFQEKNLESSTSKHLAFRAWRQAKESKQVVTFKYFKCWAFILLKWSEQRWGMRTKPCSMNTHTYAVAKHIEFSLICHKTESMLEFNVFAWETTGVLTKYQRGTGFLWLLWQRSVYHSPIRFV